MCCAIARNELYVDREMCAKATESTLKVSYQYYFANGNCERVDLAAAGKDDWADIGKFETEAECQSSCNFDTGCQAFVYFKNTKDCRLWYVEMRGEGEENGHCLRTDSGTD